MELTDLKHKQLKATNHEGFYMTLEDNHPLIKKKEPVN